MVSFTFKPVSKNIICKRCFTVSLQTGVIYFMNISNGKTYCLTGFYLFQTVFVSVEFLIQPFQAASRKVSRY